MVEVEYVKRLEKSVERRLEVGVLKVVGDVLLVEVELGISGIVEEFLNVIW